MSKTKILKCVHCSTDFEANKFANAKSATCPACKGKSKKSKSKETQVDIAGGAEVVNDLLKNDPLPEVVTDDIASIEPTFNGWSAVGQTTRTVYTTEAMANNLVEHGHIDDSTNVVLLDKEKPSAGENINAPANSMRANRNAKKGQGKPFVPNPYFLRQSMISSYLQCPDKMYDTYENGYQEDTIFTGVGTAIHGIMEDFYNDPENADVEALFDKWWTAHATSDWTWYRDWRGMVDEYFKRNTYKPNIIALELEFKVTINGVPVSGTIDRIDRIDEKTIRLVDYKTNFRPWTQAELEESIQFSVYTLALEQLKDQLGEFDTVICTYDMLRLGYTQSTTRSRETLDLFADWLKMIWEKILSGVDRKPALNQYCSHCQKRHKCALYQDVLNSDVAPVLTENTSPENLHEERERLTNTKKMMENRLKEIDEQIKTIIMDNDGVATIAGFEYTTKSQPRYSYNTSDVIRVLTLNGKSDALPEVLNVSNTNLKKILSGNKEMEDAIDSIKQATYTAPSITKKKRKG